MGRRPTLTPPLPSPRQPVILREKGVARITQNQRCAEVAGGTAAGCAAVCCCCPCGLLGLLVLAVVRLPAGLCRRAIRRRRKRERSDKAVLGDADGGLHATAGIPAVRLERTRPEEMREMERMMWEQFQGAGFWRSPSQKDSSS